MNIKEEGESKINKGTGTGGHTYCNNNNNNNNII